VGNIIFLQHVFSQYMLIVAYIMRITVN
jgi:hypothetical protein